MISVLKSFKWILKMVRDVKMSSKPFQERPQKNNYDIVIIGGAIMGSATAWFLSKNIDFDGSILIVEKDPTYQFSSTARTNSCIRQQFSRELNIRISQYTAQFIKNFQENLEDYRVPKLSIQNYGYMYMADTEDKAKSLRNVQKTQLKAGADTILMSPDEIKSKYPFYNVKDIFLGSINTVDEGYWDGGTVFDWLRRSAIDKGVEYISNEVVGINKNSTGNGVEAVRLKSGEVINCGVVVNAAGPRASKISEMIDLKIPVEARKRYTWVFSAECPLDIDLPLTIDPSGIHVRQDGPDTYLAGSKGFIDGPVNFDDFSFEKDLWEEYVWPKIANRIPAFEAIKVKSEWVGHYAYNTLDQNAIIGPHPIISNFMFINGFSGHGLQQAPAMGRGMSELLIYGKYQNLDLSPFGFDRILNGIPFMEEAII
jgi:glycine/D-amino acid oxidase-like deaminating enzyme